MIHWTEKYRTEIEIFMDHRFTMEQQLAHDLLFEFDNNDKLIGPLREMALLALADLGSFPAESVEAALRDEAAMGVMSRYKDTQDWDQSIIDKIKERAEKKEIDKFTGRIRGLSAEQCSDIIRLYGAAVEKAGGKRGADPRFTAMAKEKQFSRPEPNGGFDKKNGIFDGKGGPFRIRKDQPAPTPKDLPFWDPRRRGKDTPTESEKWQSEQWQKSLTGGPGAPFTHPTLQKLTWGQGILLKQVAAGSTVLRMDRTFGLPLGADISGTTADSIYFINKFGKLVGATDPIYQLLPLATLVFNYHHSLLEVALTLTLNKVIEYTVGFYQTLLPMDTLHPARQDLLDLLLGYEDRPDNKHILIYYEGQEVKGCYHFERGEDDSFRKVGTASFDYWNTFPHFQDFPLEWQVKSMLSRKGLMSKLNQAKSPEQIYGDLLSR